MGVDNVVRKGKIDIIDTMTFLVIPDSTRDDSGKYCLTLHSPAGEKAVFVNVKVLGKSQFSFIFFLLGLFCCEKCIIVGFILKIYIFLKMH